MQEVTCPSQREKEHNKKDYEDVQLLVETFFLWRCGPTCSMASSILRFLDHTQRHITVGRTPLDA